MNEVLLDAAPNLPTLYRQALALALRRRVTSTPPPSSLPPARHRVNRLMVDRAALTGFQHLLGAADRDQVPSAYLHTLGFPVAMSVLAGPDFPLSLLGLVHLSNEVTQTRQISVTEPLDVIASAEDLRPHASGTQVDVVIEISAQGIPVWHGRSVYLARGVRLDPGTPTSDRAPRPAFEPPTPTGVWQLDAGIGRRYAAVSGDWNPIHLSAPTAKALGMKRTIAHGMYLAARMVDEAVPAPSGALAWRIDFATPVLLPGRVSTSFTPAGDGRVDVTGWSGTRHRPHFSGWVRTG